MRCLAPVTFFTSGDSVENVIFVMNAASSIERAPEEEALFGTRVPKISTASVSINFYGRQSKP